MKITSIHTAVIPNGNILTKTDSSTNTTVNYGYTDPTWADLLTSYKGQTITYDEIGNPLTYRDGMSFTWSEGRQLSTVTKNGSVYNYYYDGEGYRSQKMVNNNSTQYTVIDGVIYGEVTYGTTGATICCSFNSWRKVNKSIFIKEVRINEEENCSNMYCFFGY